MLGELPSHHIEGKKSCKLLLISLVALAVTSCTESPHSSNEWWAGVQKWTNVTENTWRDLERVWLLERMPVSYMYKAGDTPNAIADAHGIPRGQQVDWHLENSSNFYIGGEISVKWYATQIDARRISSKNSGFWGFHREDISEKSYLINWTNKNND